MRAFVVIFFSLFSITGVYALNLEVGTVEFDAIATGEQRIHGEGGSVQGSLKEAKGKISGDLSVKLEDLSTGTGLYALRNSHMRGYLDTKKHPVAKFKFNDVDGSDGSKEFTGSLTLKGLTKPIKGTVKILTEGKTKKARAEFTVNLDDFDIAVPTYLGVTVAKEVKVLVDLKAS